jgi:DNA-binding transcriptional LysR family regulator
MADVRLTARKLALNQRILCATPAYLRSGRLRQLLSEWKLPTADVYLVFPVKSDLSAKTLALVDFLVDWFEPHRHDTGGDLGVW